jgi:hypothetical protein
MSQENVEAFKRAIEAANRQDLEGFLANCDPEVEWPRPGDAELGYLVDFKTTRRSGFKPTSIPGKPS